jgi:hypothetical protein
VTARPIDVALSFASEQVEYVRPVCVELERRSVNVFFAPFEQTELWGEDLVPYLDRVFRELATLCVMFISKEYVAKAWPGIERQSALARQMQDQAVYILPVRFDDSPVPGLSRTLHYLRATDYTAEQLADKIYQKLETAKGAPAPTAA